MKKIAITFLVACACLITTGANANMEADPDPFYDGGDWSVYGFDGIPIVTAPTEDLGEWSVEYRGNLGVSDMWKAAITPVFSELSQGFESVISIYAPISSEQTRAILPVGDYYVSTLFKVVTEPGSVVSNLDIFYSFTSVGTDFEVFVNDAEVQTTPGNGNSATMHLISDMLTPSEENGMVKLAFKFSVKEAATNQATAINFGIKFDGAQERLSVLTPEPASCTLLGIAALCGLPLARRFRKN